VSALMLWWMWGSLAPVPYIHDEAAYLLQAELLGRGRFAAPGLDLPEFFEQFHVFVTPVLAPRYPPGWGLALVPGSWLGLPAIGPILLTGLGAGLLVVLVRRLAGPATAALAWVLWTAAPMEWTFRPTYLTQHLSTVLCLVAWWALWRWRDHRRTRSLVLVSVAIAWLGITRPLTGIAFALPIALLVLYDVFRLRLWRQVTIAVAAGLPLCALIPLQNVAVVGRWDRTPLTHYAEVYTPYDVPGFGVNDTPPLVPESKERAQFRRFFVREHVGHVVERLPEILATRLTAIIEGASTPWGTAGFVVLLLIGLVAGGRELSFAAAGGVVLVLAYLWFAHPPHWTVYYLEVHLVVAAAAAIGVARLTRLLHRRQDATRDAGVLFVMTALAATELPSAAVSGRTNYREAAELPVRFRDRIAALPPGALVFLRYAPWHPFHRDDIANHLDAGSRPVLVARDLGARNRELITARPGRVPYLYDEAAGRIVPLAPDGITPLSTSR